MKPFTFNTHPLNIEQVLSSYIVVSDLVYLDTLLSTEDVCDMTMRGPSINCEKHFPGMYFMQTWLPSLLPNALL